MKSPVLSLRSPFVVFNHGVDRLHASHGLGPCTADGKDLGEISQREHSKDGFECVSVEAHCRRDMRGRLLRVRFLLVFIASCLHSRWQRRLGRSAGRGECPARDALAGSATQRQEASASHESGIALGG